METLPAAINVAPFNTAATAAPLILLLLLLLLL